MTLSGSVSILYFLRSYLFWFCCIHNHDNQLTLCLQEVVGSIASSHFCTIVCLKTLTHAGQGKMNAIFQITFSSVFSSMKKFLFNYNATDVCCSESNWQIICNGSGSGLVPGRHQAITWTNSDQVLWPIHASLGLNGLTWCCNIWCQGYQSSSVYKGGCWWTGAYFVTGYMQITTIILN